MAPRYGKWKVAALAIAVGLLAGGPALHARTARADDSSKVGAKKERKTPKPKIDGVSPDDGVLPGGTLTINGSGFSIFASDDDLADIKTYQEALKAASARVGDADAVVTQLSDAAVLIQIPTGTKKGKTKIEIDIDGKKASVDVTILDEGSREDKRKEDQKREGGGVQGASQGFLTLDPPDFSIDRGSAVIKYTGAAQGLPDGCMIAMKLTFGTQDVDTGSAEVKGGRFGGQFAYTGKALWPGKYWVNAEFVLGKQSREVRRKFEQAFAKDAAGRTAHEHDGARLPVRVGSLAQIDDQTRELKTNAASATVKAREILTDLAVAFGSAGRSGFVSGGKVDEDAWEKWLETRAYGAIVPAEKAKRLKEMQVRKDFLTGGSGFADARWRDYIDGRRDEIAAQLKEHDAYRNKFFVVRDFEGLDKIGKMWTELKNITIYWSRELYDNARVAADPKDPKISAVNAQQILKDIAWIEAHSWDPPKDADQ